MTHKTDMTFRQSPRSWLMQPPRASTWALVVAVHQGQIAGFMCWSIGTDGPFVRPEFRKVGVVDFVMASERHRGLGIGSALMTEAERLTRAAGLNRLSLMVMAGNKGAVRLYERLGFQSRAFKMLKRL